MASIVDNLSQMRLLLGEPEDGYPSDAILLEILLNETQYQLISLDNSDANWSVGSWQLDVVDGLEDYIVTAQDFDKAFCVYTADPSNPYHFRRSIPFAQLQNLTPYYYTGPQQVNLSGTHTAQAISFYRSAGSSFARVTPTPGGSASYAVLYEANTYSPAQMGQTPGLTPFHNLLKVSSALQALSECKWGTLSYDNAETLALWKDRVTTKRAELLFAQQRYQREFERYRATLQQGGIGDRIGFGDDSWPLGGLGYLVR